MAINLGLLFLRVSVGSLMFFSHGWGKLVNFSHIAPNFPDPLGVGSTVSLALAVFAEFFCSIAVIIGLKTRFAAIPLLITMLVALFLVHGNDPWKTKEFVILFIIPFTTLIITDGGSYSVDTFIPGKRK